jgi:hypothetical protein
MSIEVMFTLKIGVCHSVADLQVILKNGGFQTKLECVDAEFHLIFQEDIGIMRCSIDRGLITFITFEVWDFGTESNAINEIMFINGFEDALGDPSECI